MQWIVTLNDRVLECDAEGAAVTHSGALVLGNFRDRNGVEYVDAVIVVAPGKWRLVERQKEVEQR